tara:strand:+ start:973 stop:1167 length:195 start_codon:yes stop_codon:yes gene_type:complete
MTSYQEHFELLAEISKAEKEKALEEKCADRRIIAYLDQLDGTDNDDIKLEYSCDLFREFGVRYE